MSVYRKNVVFKLLLGVGVTLCLVGMDTGEIDPVFLIHIWQADKTAQDREMFQV
jgi:hypothetical protein